MFSTEQLYLSVKGKWKSIYPIYFNAKKTIKEGRRLPKKSCIDHPTLPQLAEAVAGCKLRLIVEQHKSYPRDYLEYGRLKVEVYNEKGNFIYNHITNKKQMMKQTALNLQKLRHK